MSVIEAISDDRPLTGPGSVWALIERLIEFHEQLDFENNPREAMAEWAAFCITLIILYCIIDAISPV